MNKIILAVVALATLALTACGAPATITTPDGWILPDTGNVTRCVNDDNITLCTDTVTGERYLNGERVSR